MNQTPFEFIEGLRIGSVEFVSPDVIKIGLDTDSPDSIALNPGTPRVFPRINSYLIIPNEEGFFVGQIEWITIEKSPFPKRQGMKDFGLIDIPFPQKKLSLNPIGTLKIKSQKNIEYLFHRGVDSFPNIGDSVFLPTDIQLRSIVESGFNRRVNIGISPLAGNATVSVDPDRLFGRHLAVLGNTGSGKSCSVAGLIRWSLEMVYNEINKTPNSRFIIFDPNSEFSRAFSDNNDYIKKRVFKVNPMRGENALTVPLWFWNSAEWCTFTQASYKAQKPTLHQALRNVRSGFTNTTDTLSISFIRHLRNYIQIFNTELKKGDIFGNFPYPKRFYTILEAFQLSIEDKVILFEENDQNEIRKILTFVQNLQTIHKKPWSNGRDFDYDPYQITEIEKLIEITQNVHNSLGGDEVFIYQTDIDAPLKFEGEDLIKNIEATAELLKVSSYTETLIMRIRTLLENTRMSSIINDNCSDITLEKWLTDIIGDKNASNGTITIIDLSLIPTEIIHLIVSVIARMVFEALQRYRKINNSTLPTVLIMEEAHTYIKKYQDNFDTPNSDSICCQTFERIAREGRKFGLGLVLSSQRPSELSPTVLSQCNTFLLHRITNDRDQDLIHRFLPDNLRGLLRELPSLPSQNAILLGWASEIPLLVKINSLSQNQQPNSEDPKYWDSWTNELQDPNIKYWDYIAKDWQGVNT